VPQVLVESIFELTLAVHLDLRSHIQMEQLRMVLRAQHLVQNRDLEKLFHSAPWKVEGTMSA